MTPDQSRSVVAILVAAFPGAPADEATINLFVNALAGADYEHAQAAAVEHVRTSNWWPTVAELNRLITDRRRHEARNATPITGRIRCDGSGWNDRGAGCEPCPACNPWLHLQHAEGDLHAERRQQAPKDYVMPAPCRPAPEGPVVPPEQGWSIAAAAYRQACADEGRPPTPHIAASLDEGTYPIGATA